MEVSKEAKEMVGAMTMLTTFLITLFVYIINKVIRKVVARVNTQESYQDKLFLISHSFSNPTCFPLPPLTLSYLTKSSILSIPV